MSAAWLANQDIMAALGSPRHREPFGGLLALALLLLVLSLPFLALLWRAVASHAVAQLHKIVTGL